MFGEEVTKGKAAGGSAFTEGVTAIQTTEVGEYVGIDSVAEGGAGGAASRATDEAAEDGARNAAERSTDRAGEHAKRSAGFRAGDSHRDTASSTHEGTGRAADFGCAVERFGQSGLTARAENRHQYS